MKSRTQRFCGKNWKRNLFTGLSSYVLPIITRDQLSILRRVRAIKLRTAHFFISLILLNIFKCGQNIKFNKNVNSVSCFFSVWFIFVPDFIVEYHTHTRIQKHNTSRNHDVNTLMFLGTLCHKNCMLQYLEMQSLAAICWCKRKLRRKHFITHDYIITYFFSIWVYWYVYFNLKIELKLSYEIYRGVISIKSNSIKM